MLTKNFSLEEVTNSPRAIQEGITEQFTPPNQIIANAALVAHFTFQPLRDYLGRALSVGSWYRSPRLNQAVGGSSTSFHLLGFAGDLTTSGSNGDIWKAVLESGVPFTEMIIEFGTLDNPSWVHLAFDGNNTREILRATSGSSGTIYSAISEESLRAML